MTANASPGPWKLVADGRTYYVYRLSHGVTGWREYLAADGRVTSRPSRFKKKDNALAAIERAAKPCPEPAKGEKCPLCKSYYECLQFKRPKTNKGNEE